MSLKIVRQDITKMNTEAVVNTANRKPRVGSGCDTAIYEAAGYEELLAYRKENIGEVPEGEAFLTPGFHLPAKYIIHTVSPLYINGAEGEEEKLRACYRNSLQIAAKQQIKSIAFPLIATGSFGYPKEEGLRIAVDEINAFLLHHDMLIYLVVFDEKATTLGEKLYPDLEAYIDRHYVEEKSSEEYMNPYMPGWNGNLQAQRTMFSAQAVHPMPLAMPAAGGSPKGRAEKEKQSRGLFGGLFEDRRKGRGKAKEDHFSEDFEREFPSARFCKEVPSESLSRETSAEPFEEESCIDSVLPSLAFEADAVVPVEDDESSEDYEFAEIHEQKLQERLRHRADTFSQYLMYMIQEKGMENADVYKRGVVDKKVFSKIKNHVDYHPEKLTALCLCVGAKLNLDETKDLLARAGYALSPCDQTDIIFSYFIENKIYDMIDLDIQLEEHGLPCVIK